MKNTLLPFILLLCCQSVYSQMNKIEYEEYGLQNGLHVILHKDNSIPIVAVSVMYHVGSKNEDPERTGFAHFFEHLLFEGSENIGRGEYDSYVERAGGTLNANTTYDRTYYYEILPSNQLELGLWLESERMLHAKVNNEGIETQREVVKEERRMRYENQPYGTMIQETLKRLYTQHPYQWPVIGYMEHLNAAEEQDYLNFYKDFYVPNNAILSIAGDIDIEQTKEWIEKYFSTIPTGTKEIYRPTIEEPQHTSEVRDTIYDNVQLPAVIQAYKIPAQGTKEFYAVSMMAKVLSQGKSSRLKKSLVDDQQKAMYVSAFPFELEDPGVSINFAMCNMGVDPKEVELAIDVEIEKLKNELITDEEYIKLQNQVENEYVSANSRIAGIAESLANYHMYYGDTELINTELNRYLEVTKKDIQDAANNYFDRNSRVVLYYMPMPTEQP